MIVNLKVTGMKYNILKNGNVITTCFNKLSLYEKWEQLHNLMDKLDNFDCYAGFWMRDKDKNIFEVERNGEKYVKYDRSEFDRLKMKRINIHEEERNS